MNITAETWSTVSKLLDEALDLAPAERADWLRRMAARDPAVAPTLERLLAAHARVETDDILRMLPPLEVSEPTATGALRAGDRVGPYRLKRELGTGGMAVVWLAERADGAFERDVALKLPQISRLRRDLAERFARERDILAKLEHPHIARLYDAGVSSDGLPYLALEYVEGEPITTYCDQHKLDVRARLQLFAQVLDAVQYAHAHLVIHRDLKPSNILVTGEGQVRLLDFGIAKLLNGDESAPETQLTQATGRALTPDYASPEQILGQPLTVASDVYSLGVVLYELLARARPYRLARASRGALEDGIVESVPPPPSAQANDPALRRKLVGDLDTIVLKALKKAPAERYPAALALADDLVRHLQGEPVLARPDGGWYRARKFLSRHRAAASAAALLSIVVLGAAVFSLWQARLARAEANRAEQVKRFIASIFTQARPRDGEGGEVTASDLLQAAGKRIDTELAGDPRAAAELGVLIGESFDALGEPGRAEETLRAAVQRSEREYGPRHPATLRAKVLLVQAYHGNADYTASRPLLERLVPDLLAELPGSAAQAVAALRSLSFVQAKYNEAEASYASLKHAIDIGERYLGRLHGQTIDALGLLSNTYGRFGAGRLQLEAAEEAVRRVREAHGTRRPQVQLAVIERWYAAALTASNRVGEAVPVLEGALRDQRALDNADTVRVRAVMHELAIAYAALGRYGVGLPLMRRTVAAEAEQVKAASSDRASLQQQLGAMLVDARQLDEGLAWIERSEATVQALAAPEPPQWRLNRNIRRARALMLLGRFDEAEQLIAQLGREIDSTRPTYIAELLTLRAAAARLQGRDGEAEKMARAAVERTFAPDVPSASLRAAAATELGLALLEQGDAIGAEASFARAREVLPANQPQPTPRTALLWIGLARVDLLHGRAEDAEREAESAFRAWQEVAPRSDDCAVALYWLSQAQARRGNSDEAARSRRRALAVLRISALPGNRRLALHGV